MILDIKNYNWGLIGPDSWKERQWIIYDDMSVSYNILYNSSENNEHKSNFVLRKDEFDKIINNIKLAKNDNTKVDACDGEVWEFVEYDNGEKIWKRDLGYIYGIFPLENIVSILIK